MELKAKLESALHEAMRSSDDVRRRTIRMILSAIRLMEVEKGGALDDQAILAILHKEVKSRQETIEEAKKGQREDLIKAAEEEIRVIREFLPQPLRQEELVALAQAAIVESGASGPVDMGKVMKILMPRIQGRVSGDVVSQTVRQLLQQRAG
jgi:uncharacterized protein YqeY